MSDTTGEVTAKLGGKTYRLYLGMRGIGQLQQEFGKDLAPIMEAAGGMPEAGDGDQAEAASLPDLQALIRVVEVSLARFHSDEADDYLAGDLLQADIGLAPRLIFAAIPQVSDDPAPSGTSPRRGKAAPAGKSKARR